MPPVSRAYSFPYRIVHENILLMRHIEITLDLEFVSRKHWIAYVIPAVILLFGILMLTGTHYWRITGLLVIVGAACKIISLRTVRWKITPEELDIKGGILPWSRTELNIPIFDVYDAAVSKGMFGYFLGYAHITIRGTEGVTTHTRAKYLAGGTKLSGYINAAVRAYKERKHTVIINQAAPVAENSIADELAKLSELKNNGAITQEEYQRLKENLLNRH